MCWSRVVMLDVGVEGQEGVVAAVVDALYSRT
jgi:hypothetical protein